MEHIKQSETNLQCGSDEIKNNSIIVILALAEKSRPGGQA